MVGAFNGIVVQLIKAITRCGEVVRTTAWRGNLSAVQINPTVFETDKFTLLGYALRSASKSSLVRRLHT